MILMTQEVRKLLPKLYSTEETPPDEKVVQVNRAYYKTGVKFATGARP